MLNHINLLLIFTPSLFKIIFKNIFLSMPISSVEGASGKRVMYIGLHFVSINLALVLYFQIIFYITLKASSVLHTPQVEVVQKVR
jgi:hypothetical protein